MIRKIVESRNLESGKVSWCGCRTSETESAQIVRECPLKPGFMCLATDDLADQSRCRCPYILYYDIRAERDTSPLLLVDDPGDYINAIVRMGALA